MRLNRVFRAFALSRPAPPLKMQTILEQNVDSAAATSETNRRGQSAQSAPETARPRKYVQHAIVLLTVWIVSMGWMATRWDQGWVPHDDGMLAQSAGRVMHGQLPHRDFDEVYTGGLDYLHAAGFRIFGENLLSLRKVLFIFFALWVPVLYYCATRFGGPISSGMIALLAVAWSVPIYPASMPSWYNLFFATFGLAALLRFIEVRTRKWLFIAGVCAGASFVIKIAGLYFVAAALIFLVFLEQSDARLATSAGPGESPDKLYRFALVASVFGFIAVLVRLVWHLVSVSEIYFFVAPGAMLGCMLLVRAADSSRIGNPIRFRRILNLELPFLAGALAPIVAFLAPYLLTDSLGSFYKGVFVVPFIRVAKASFPPPSPGDLIALIPLLAIILVCWYSKLRESLALTSLICAICAAVLYYAPSSRIVYQFAFKGLSASMPVVIAAGVWALTRSSRSWSVDLLGSQRLFLVLSVAALCSLIQFPYSSPTYFCYVFPLLALATLAIFSARRPMPRAIPAALVAFYTLFSCLYVTPVFALDGMAGGYYNPLPTLRMESPRAGGLSVAFPDATQYDALVTFVAGKSKGHEIYAGPDSPEVYFLVGSQNPTRTIFEFLEDYSTQTARVVAAIDRSEIKVIVINHAQKASDPLPHDLLMIFKERFPETKSIGKFEVRWRD